MTRGPGTIVVCALLLLTACAAAAEPADAGGGARPEDLRVFAAASLTDAFTEIGQTVEDARPGLSVTFNFAGSQRLATQIVEGAPADVYASADTEQMAAVTDAGRVARTSTFATNRLAIAVEPGNPRGVATLADLARDDVTVVLAAAQVPAGRYARDALDAAGVSVSPVSLETDVRAVLTKVALGEADAGIVYTSDVTAAADRVDSVEIPERDNVIATYPIGALADAANPDAARAFIAAVLSDEGRATLTRLGFGPP